MNNKLNFQSFTYNINNTISFYDIAVAIQEFDPLKLFLIQIKQANNTTNQIRLATTFKVKLEDGQIKNISTLQIIDKAEVDNLKCIFYTFWVCKYPLYRNYKITQIILTYKFIEGHFLSSMLIEPSSLDNNELLLQIYYEYLPNNRLSPTWGEEFIILDNNQYMVNKDNGYSYFIINIENEYFITVSYKKEILYRFHDIYNINSCDDNTFIRIIGNFEVYYRHGTSYVVN